MKIATKLYGILTLMLVLSAILGLYASYQIKNTLLQAQGKNSILKSREIIKRLDQTIYNKIMEVGAATRRSWVINIVTASNQKYAQKENIVDQVAAPDSLRHRLKPLDSEFSPSPLEANELANELRAEFIHFYEYQQGYRVLSYILVTNRYGVVIARTEPLTGISYDQDKWWQAARQSDIYIGEVEYDKATDSYGIPAAFSIVDANGDFAGVLKTMINIKAIIHSLDLGLRNNNSSRFTLLTSSGRVIYRTLPYRFMEDFSNWQNFPRLQGRDGYFAGRSITGRKRFYSYARSEGYKLYEGSGWIFMVGIDQDEILATAILLRNRIVFASLALVLLFSLLAFLLSRSIIGSLTRLNQGVQRFGEGDLDFRLDLNSKDEHGRLAKTFNEMADNLQQITASRDELDREVGKRLKAQEKIIHLNTILRAIRDINLLITKENDPEKLIRQACDILVRTRGYRAAWIVLLDETDNTLLAAAGEPDNFVGHRDLFVKGVLPDCGRRLLNQTDVRVIDDVASDCGHCSLAPGFADQKALTARLKHHETLYGVLTVYMSNEYSIGDEELDLFRELAGDIGFALHKIAMAENLLRSEKRFQSTFEQAAVGIALVSPDGEFLQVNRRLCDIVGYTREELLQRTFQDISHPEELKSDQDNLQQVLEDKIKTYDLEKRYIHKDGTLIWTHLTVSLVRDLDGSPDYFIAMVEDISEQKKAEEQIKNLNAELEQRIIERTAQLEASNKELEAFAYSVSHDLRAPLRAIGGYSQMLLEDHADSLNAEGQRKLNVVQDSAEEMGRLIDGLLSFSRLGRSTMKFGPVNMENMVKDIFAGLQRDEKTDTALLRVMPLPPALGDATMLRSVFTNLLSNSIKFTKPGKSPNIEVGSRQEPHETVYYVRDQGVGFDMKYADKLFKVFQRLHSAKDFQGTGIGLALVQRIINRHGGRVWAEGEINKGTTIYFTLPTDTAGL